MPLDETPRLLSTLRDHQVAEAWAGSFEGLLHKAQGSVNSRLTDECRRRGGGILRPVGSINPRLPDWEYELRRCALEHRMPGIRLHPNYHGYGLEDPAFERLLRVASDLGLWVQLALAMEDERMMHPLMRVLPVDPTPLSTVLKVVPKCRLLLVNALRTLRAKPLLELLSTGQVWVEISMLEGIGGLGTLLSQVRNDRVLFGSHAPLFYFESALLKLQESELTQKQLDAIVSGNASSLVKTSPLKHRHGHQ